MGGIKDIVEDGKRIMELLTGKRKIVEVSRFDLSGLQTDLFNEGLYRTDKVEVKVTTEGGQEFVEVDWDLLRRHPRRSR